MVNALKSMIVRYAIIIGVLAGGMEAYASLNQPQENQPIFNPHTKSYIQLVRIGTGYSIRSPILAEISWRAAESYARSRKYKGVRGHLAVVKDHETHEFIERKFRLPKPTWIGLRLFCKNRKLLWVTGEVHPLKGFKVWATRWKRVNGFACHKNKSQIYAPIYYTRTTRGLRWKASGIKKEYYYLLIEYPARKN